MEGSSRQLPHGEENAAAHYPTPEGDSMHSHAEPQTVEQLVVLKHFKDSNFGVLL
jgi:hypothetical protein